jgi:hypothetical protein
MKQSGFHSVSCVLHLRFSLVFVALVSVHGVGRGRQPDFPSWSFSVLAGSPSDLVSLGFSATRSRFGFYSATVPLAHAS